MASVVFGDVQNWEELNDLIAGLQTWVGQQEGAGRWVDIPYSTTLFGSSAGTWTVVPGNLFIYQYTVNQDVMRLRLHLGGTTTASMSNQLFLTLPDGWRCRDSYYIGPLQYAYTGTFGTGAVTGSLSNGRRLNLVRDILAASTNWPNVTNDLSIYFSLTIPVIRE